MAISPPITSDSLLEITRWVLDRPWLAAVAGLGVLAALGGQQLLADWRHRRMTDGAGLLTIAPPPQVDQGTAADLWRTLAGVLTPSTWRRLLYGIPHVVFEYSWTGRQLQIQLWVPGSVPRGAAIAAIRSAWPSASITEADAVPPLPVEGTLATGGRLYTRLPDVLPLRTDHDNDPLRPLLAAGADTRNGEHTLVQIHARPARASRLRRARAVAARMREGGSVSGGGPDLVGIAVAPLLWLVELFLPGPSTRSATARGTAVRRDPVAERDIRMVVDKALSGAVFEVDARYIVATAAPRSQDPQVAQRLNNRLRGLAHAVASAFAIHAGRNSLQRRKMPHPLAVAAGRRMSHGFLAGVDELAALAALPQDLAVPGLDRARAKAVPAPVTIPAGGGGTKPLGIAQVGGHRLAMPVASASEHIHLIGKTGSGKSTLITHMVLDDVAASRGAVVIDPKGDLVNDILARLPYEVADRVVLIDPEQENQPAINPLEGDDRELAVDNIVGIFAKIFARFWGPRIDDVLRVSLLTLLTKANATLSLVPPLLNSDQFRAEYTVDLDDPSGLHGFWAWYDSMNAAARAQIIGPVLARLRAFLLRDFVRRTIGQPKSTFDLGDVLDGGLLLVRLPKGVLGDETCRVLGSIILAKTWQAATARSALPEAKRRPAMLYVDEAQNFLNLPSPVGDMLAEARGYRLGMLLAHQNLAQLPKDVAEAVSANARNKIYFNVDPGDAKDLAKHVAPEVDEHDLAKLDAHTAVGRIVINHRELPAFTFTTLPPVAAAQSTLALRQRLSAAHPAQAQSAAERKARNDMRAERERRAARSRAQSGAGHQTDDSVQQAGKQ
ncbi:type IV secretory system conjugative DNA transfer family protein [Catellatospora paridis]|uniref:type IV secretory system conjugative DNA transfer family protein n=1 Tax=Catellatospora paridis TaxID=1617086 RepID=UPI0012D3A600|nr:type IV secretion system DNA-binding domain-containing protein [Catellatospora paridis]